MRVRNRCRFSLKCRGALAPPPYPLYRCIPYRLYHYSIIFTKMTNRTLYLCSLCHYANLNTNNEYHTMSILLRRLPFQRTLQQRYRSCECPESTNILSTTFKVNVCMLFCTNVICSSIARAVYILKEDQMECEKRCEKQCEKRWSETK